MYKAESIQPLKIIGLMSGTSVDGVDACCVELAMVAGRLEQTVLATHSKDIPEDLRTRLLTAMAEKTVHLQELCALNVAVGELFADAALELMRQNDLPASELACIGSHGQTLYHWPPAEGRLGGTLQIGEPSIIAERTGVRVIADFRPRDMAAGGHGAPLVCFADVLLFQDEHVGRCVQNIGGIANVTVIPPRKLQRENGVPVIAFDTGPGNMLMDAATQRFFDQPYDPGGELAGRGRIFYPLLKELLSHPYFQEPPPKTTGRELFGAPFLERLLHHAEYSQLPPADWLATLNMFTAQSIAEAYERFVFPHAPVDEVIIGGGGVYNATLLANLRQLFKEKGRTLTVNTHADLGIHDKYKEALAFAVLAWASLMQRPNNIPTCTGARHNVIMGKHVF